MSHCHDEHDHDHSHGGGGHVHDHSDDITPALQSLLYDSIEFDKINTLNESESDAGRKIVQKTWAQRLDPEPALQSDADEQLIMTVPFAGTVRLHSLLIRSSSSDSAPKTLKLYLNKDSLDFSTASDLQPTQVIVLSQTSEIQDVPVKRALFNNTYSLSLFVEDNYGADETDIFYLGFKGEFTKLHREAVEVMYEKAANPRDHQTIVGIGEMGGSKLGQ